MSVQTLCFGWHWTPQGYSRNAVDVNGLPVPPVPEWMIRVYRRALALTGFSELAHSPDATPDAVLVNYYHPQAKMGMHRDADEPSEAPVVSLSVGQSCIFRFGNTASRTRPWHDVELASGDVVVFGGHARRAFHGVTKLLPNSAPSFLDGLTPNERASDGIFLGRLNLTLRVTGLGS